jgi:hypothetical protein
VVSSQLQLPLRADPAPHRTTGGAWIYGGVMPQPMLSARALCLQHRDLMHYLNAARWEWGARR